MVPHTDVGVVFQEPVRVLRENPDCFLASINRLASKCGTNWTEMVDSSSESPGALQRSSLDRYLACGLTLFDNQR